MPEPTSRARVAAAWGVHLLTASSAPAGILAILAAIRGEHATAFWWMAYTLAIDSIDGTLARRVDVKRVVPWVDGARLDDCVDYFTYVIVPAVFALVTGLVPPTVGILVVACMSISSGYGFAQTAAKTADHFFTGFPSYWNVVVFYLYVLGWPPALNVAVLILFSVAVFVPIRYVYPSRTPTLRALTVTLGIVWALALCWILLHVDTPTPAVVHATLLYPIYYVALSLALHRTTTNPVA